MRKSLIQHVVDKITEEQKGFSVEELVADLNPNDFGMESVAALKAVVHTDLMVDGRFVMINGNWDLKNRFSMNDIKKHRSLEIIGLIHEDEDMEFVEESKIDELGNFVPKETSDDDDDEVTDLNDFIDSDILSEFDDED